MSDRRRFLIATWDGGGNTPPAFNLGTRLTHRGHRVRVLGWESMAKRSADAGLEFATYLSMTRWPENLSLDDGWDRLVPFLHGTATRDDIIAEADAFMPDVLVLDCMMGASFAAARRLRKPTAVLVHGMYSACVSAWGDQVMQTSVLDLFAATDLVLALVPPGFDAPVALPSNTSYVGPITRPESERGGDGRWSAVLAMIARPGDPWILLSLSTTLQRQTEALPAMLDAVEGLPVRVLLTLGGVLPADSVDAPSNVTVCEFVPHDVVLSHMAAVICHGGLSTITAALAAGVSLVCIPQGRDQHINAARVVASGVGQVLATDASAAEIARAVRAVVENRSMREAARRLADEVAALGGGEQATIEVEQLAESRIPQSERGEPAMASIDEGTAFRRASEGFVERARKIGPEQWSGPTPCTEWDVRTLVNHVAGEYLWVPEMLAGKTIADVGDRLDGDVLGDDPLQTLVHARNAALAALDAPGALEATTHLSFGDVPARAYVQQMTIDSVIHTWDLAHGIGADDALDPELVDLSYADLKGSAEEWRSAGVFGPETAPSGETTQAKLLALTGR